MHQEAFRNAETKVKEETGSAHPGAGQSSGTVAPRPNSDNARAALGPDVAGNHTKEAVDGAGSACPDSMKDYDLPPSKPKSLAPHLRDAPQSAPVPSSMRDLDNQTVTPKPARKREKVRIRRTSQGWEEIDENEKALNGEQATEGIPEDAKVQDAGLGVESSAGDDRTVDTVMQEAETQKEVLEPPLPSTQASWQAFASTASAESEASIGFKVRLFTE